MEQCKIIKALQIIIVIFLVSISFAKEAEKVVVLPNPKIVGKKIQLLNTSLLMTLTDNSAKNIIYPFEIVVDIEDGKVTAIKASYNNSLGLEEVVSEINKLYKKWALKGFENTNMRLWRVEPYKFAISVSQEENCIEVIILPFRGRVISK